MEQKNLSDTMANSHPKQAQPDRKILDVFKKRWSPRAFSDKMVEKDTLLRLFEAARWAPSSFNEQPWNFIVANKNQEKPYQKILDSLAEFNQSWAKTAPVLAVSITKDHFSKNNKPNVYSVHDVGLAMGNLLTQATDLGVYVHQMAGFDKNKFTDSFSIPNEFSPVAAMAIGYLGDPAQLPENLQEAETQERSRKPVEEFVYAGEWKKPII